jgi:hypothetical protein
VSLTKHKTRGRVLEISKVRRRQKRQPRRLLESPPQDWKKWDRFAKMEGINWSEFTRRALEQRCSSLSDLEGFVLEHQDDPEMSAVLRARLPGFLRDRLPGREEGAFYGTQISARARESLSEKPPRKNGAPAAAKKRAAGARGKGSSRS